MGTTPSEAWGTIRTKYIDTRKVEPQNTFNDAEAGIARYLDHPSGKEDACYTALLADMAVKCCHSSREINWKEAGPVREHAAAAEAVLKQYLPIKEHIKFRWLLGLLLGLGLAAFGAYSLFLADPAPEAFHWVARNSYGLTFLSIPLSVVLIFLMSRKDLEEDQWGAVILYGMPVVLILSLILKHFLFKEIPEYKDYEYGEKLEYAFGVWLMLFWICYGIYFALVEFFKLHIIARENAAAAKAEKRFRKQFKEVQPHIEFIRKYCKQRIDLAERLKIDTEGDNNSSKLIGKCRLEAYGRLYSQFLEEFNKRPEALDMVFRLT